MKAHAEPRKSPHEKTAQSSQDLSLSKFFCQDGKCFVYAGSWSLRPDLTFDYWSPETFVCLGVDPSIGIPTLKDVIAVTHPDDRDLIVRTAEKMIYQGIHSDITYRIIHPERGLRFMRNVGDALFENGQVKCCIGNTIDITEQEQLIQELHDRKCTALRCNAYLAQAQALSHTGCFGWNITSGELYWSEETFRILGYNRNLKPTLELVFNRVHPDDLHFVQQTIEHAGEVEHLDFEHRLLMPDGSIKHLHIIARRLETESGDLELVGSVMDISDSRETLEEIKTLKDELYRENITLREEILRIAVDTTPAFIHTGRPDGYLDYFNRGWLELIGKSLDEVCGWRWTESIHPDDVDGIVQKWRAALASGEPFEAEARVQCANGTYHAFLHRNVPLHDEHGNIVKWFGSSIDIEDRKQAEEKVREQETELRQILDLAPEHLFIFGSDGQPLYANQVALEYYGIGLDRLLTEPRSNFVHPDDRDRFRAEREKGTAEGTPHEFEVRFLKHNGTFRWFLVRRNPLKDEQGHITRWLAAATDIEERKQAEERLREENAALRKELSKTPMFEEVIGTSPVLERVLERVAKVAPTDSTVLIMGETGTGKELIARAIHRGSKRSEGPFTSLNCAAVPSSLIMSELFGHEKGAFTGALQRRPGRFELAEGGTIFLDEVGDLPTETQIALLRVLQEREFERLGGTAVLRCDVRIIAATNRDLEAAIADGTFRMDLYYRLNVFPVELPPLRERKEDIPILVNYFVNRYAKRVGKKTKSIRKRNLELLQNYSWPGNVRELQNVIERALIISETDEVCIDENWFPSKAANLSAANHSYSEREQIEAALAQTKGKVSGSSGAAAKLGVPPSTLEWKIRSLRINKFQFK